ncbi:MAG: flavodoxin-dependent (E)-4-hydroxy-3-methylbut-2-enyl-diphosphate synthase [Clostridia bacterium]|nr:flavodoxin-dependent (E)-4-hydroxy-3-methylbut-2-enyl-diphosphate synthase [Clostridia bacterium]
MNYNDIRKKTRCIKVGDVTVGGTAPVAIQSMTNTDTSDREATLRQVISLRDAGCDIVRLTAPTLESVRTFEYIKSQGIDIPLVADIHFDYKIAIAAAKGGADKIRINPGNIGDDERVREVVLACRENRVPIRIGVNSGSLEKHILKKYGTPCAEALAESAMYHISLLERYDFQDIAVSVKSSDAYTMIRANRLLSEATDYPIHLGVTEAGFGTRAVIKSSIGIGALLSEGIGDTLRVSLTDKPEEEISAAREILSTLGIGDAQGMDIVSCPTCGRTKIDLIALTREFEARAMAEGLMKKNIKVALMGCVVNGPGEAREADVGIAGGNGEGLLFKRGEIIRKLREEELIDALLDEIRRL